MSRRLPQVNVRLDEETFEVLEAAVFLGRLSGMQELLRPVIEGYAQSIARDARIRAALDLRSEVGATRSGAPRIDDDPDVAGPIERQDRET